MIWCRSCVLPDTRPNLRIAEDGVCNACRAHGTKRRIDWAARRRQLEAVAASARQASAGGYDCVIPVSGGKDSTWQVVKCLELGLKPLAVTWRPPGRTAIGQRNLDNLIRLGVDHVDWSIAPDVEARFMLAAFERHGSTAIPMHLALFSIPLTIAVRFRIPLVVWGENSAFEYGSRDEADTGFRLDAAWLRTYGVTQGTVARDWLSDQLSAKDLIPYSAPSEAELDAAGVRAVFLGYYLEWDPEETRRVAMAHGFSSDAAGPRTGYYDFADIDDDFISLHHWMKWYKFGFTRLFDNLSLEIRNGRMTREAAIAVIRATGDQTPHADIDRFCAFAGIDRARFLAIAETFRNPAIWQRRADGRWHIPDFLLPDWTWT
ncbi:MAG: N-acetyl sugar amidotransferase [Hyphomicrobiales bacterium]|uniref:N-acetyl sugar amidotransferase n=1 Tax=Rhabdaerophilum calidifontis TaxID=2604328 RepID=UPI001238ACFA|nr:N-acetyl sugar amidotransferase [Rhabdaerophilum calidifontis]MCA1999321.1 N-acetyl sugar amidotransferase [Hyphomicrobiales bacterium]